MAISSALFLSKKYFIVGVENEDEYLIKWLIVEKEGESMIYKVFGYCYKNDEEYIKDVRARACNFRCYTPEREIESDSIDDIPQKYLDIYGKDLDLLWKKERYLFAMINGEWIRLTD